MIRLAGVDEAGRGPLAGPVVAAAVILTEEQERELVAMGLKDSKKMTALRRSKVFCRLIRLGCAYGVAFADVARIDRDNILQATLWAMRRAVAKLPRVPQGVIVDGSFTIPSLDLPQQALPGADDRYPCVSAASVVAKVLRDRYMIALDRRYPAYGFASHKGYGTAAHRRALQELGPTPYHRRSFSWGLK